MLTTHCTHCGSPKSPETYANDFCTACETVVKETAEFVARENAAREAVEAENRKLIEKNREGLENGSVKPEAIGLKPVQPLIDPVEARKDALLRRAHNLRGSAADPRSPFDPGLRDARYSNLGMGAKVSPNVDWHRS